MINKLRLVLIGFLAIAEAFALAIALPLVVLAIVAYGLLICARSASSGVRNVSPAEHPSAVATGGS